MKKWLRTLLKVLIVIAVLDVVWFFSTRAYLRSDKFFSLINKKTLQFDATDGYSPWPGYFVFENFVFTGFSKQTTYQVTAKKVSFTFNFLNLARRHVTINGLNASEVMISVADGPLTKAEAKEAEKAEKKAEEEKKEETGKDKPLWVTEFTGAEFDHVKEIRLMDWVWSGDTAFDASWVNDNKKHFTLANFEADTKRLDVTREDKKFVTIDEANIKISTDEIDLDNKDWKTILPKIESHWKVKGKMDRVESLEAYTKDLEWIALSGTPLTVDGDFGIDDGKFLDGSKLQFTAETLHIALLHQNIIGPATFSWSVKDTNHVELKFGEYTLNKGRDGSGKGFSLVLDTPEKDIIPEWKVWDAHVSIPRTEIHRLQFLQKYIPKSLPLTLEKGKGYLQGEFHASSNVAKSKGLFEIKVQDVQTTYNKNLRFVGSAQSKMKITRIDPRKGEVSIADAGVDVTNLSFLDKKDWKGSLHFTDTRIKYEKPTSLSANMELQGDNLQPVLAFLIKDKKFPEFVMKAFDLKNPKVTMKIAAADKSMQVRDFDARAGDLAMRGWFDQKLQDAKARFLVEYAGLAGGYGFENDKTEWKISGAKDWYNKVPQSRM